MQERLATLKELVDTNLRQAQKTQKSWYDQHARDRNFEPGDKVLVLLPTSTSKLMKEWQGPFSITRKVGKVTYEIRHAKQTKTPLNFPRKHASRMALPHCTLLLVSTEDPDDDDGDIDTLSNTNDENPTLGDGLVERFSHTLKMMLKTTAAEGKKLG